MDALLTLERVSKRYGALQAVADVSLDFAAGSIHAVIGENGAGKSTLFQMAAGVVVPSGGQVRVDGVRLDLHTPAESIARGVGLVPQHFGLIGALTALENAMLGAEPRGWSGALDTRRARRRAEKAAQEMGAPLPWNEPVDRLGVAERQRVAIVRALLRDVRVLLLDEPTAVLTPAQAQALYATLHRLAEGGRAIGVVTHRLDEVAASADRVSVLRRGRLVSTRTLRAGNTEDMRGVIAEAMGEASLPPIERRPRVVGAPRLEARDLWSGDRLRGATLRVRAGETVGIAGVEGNGQGELVRVFAGLDRPDRGEIRVDGGVAVVHEDRHREGLVIEATIGDNLLLGELARFARFGVVVRSAIEREATARLQQADLPGVDPAAPVRTLSGGNQQKVIVARALARGPRVSSFVLAQPTRGLDLGSARAVHRRVAAAADAGMAVLIVSGDLAELRLLCDRILVLARGRVVADFPPDVADTLLGAAMLGREEATP